MRQRRGRLIVEESAQGRKAHHVEGAQGNAERRHAFVGRFEHRVDRELLVLDSNRIQLSRRSGHLMQSRAIGASHQHDGGERAVGQRLDGCREPRLLHLQARVRTETRSSLGGRLQESGPCARQAEQPQGVPGGCGVEQHMVERHARLVAREEPGKLVERRDLDRTGARQLLTELDELGFRPDAAVGRDHPLAVVVGGLLGIDVERPESLDTGHGRGTIGADEQDALPGLCEANGSRACERRLADPALPGEDRDSGSAVRGRWSRSTGCMVRASGAQRRSHWENTCAGRSTATTFPRVGAATGSCSPSQSRSTAWTSRDVAFASAT
jgi:hypothetical protein